MKSNCSLFLLIFCCFSTLFGQAKLDTIVAQTGDGIFSILRNAGIHPVRYYAEFLDLNKDGIKGASELVVGTKYILPHAPDSFKNRGRKVAAAEEAESPIFDAELAQLQEKDSTLKDAVYYIVYVDEELNRKEDMPLETFTGKLAKELLIRGARVYLLPKSKTLLGAGTTDQMILNSKMELGDITNVVNKKYLMHFGSYQRVLMIGDAGLNKKGITLGLQYYEKNPEGQALAEKLREVFAKDALKQLKPVEGVTPFTDEVHIYLAKNMIASVTTLYLNGNADVIKLRSAKTNLPGLILKGVLVDHSEHKGAN